MSDVTECSGAMMQVSAERWGVGREPHEGGRISARLIHLGRGAVSCITAERNVVTSGTGGVAEGV